MRYQVLVLADEMNGPTTLTELQMHAANSNDVVFYNLDEAVEEKKITIS